MPLSLEEQRKRWREANARYRKKNREKIRTSAKARYLRNRDKELERLRKYRAENLERCREKDRLYKTEHRLEINRKKREKYWRDPEAARAKDRAYQRGGKHRAWFAAWRKRYYSNPENKAKLLAAANRWKHTSAAFRAWRGRNAEKLRDQFRRWKAANPEKYQASVAKFRRDRREHILAKQAAWKKTPKGRAADAAKQSRRRERKRRGSVSGDLAAVRAFYLFVRTAEQIDCHWCGRSIPKGPRMRTVDHVIPIAKGGPHAVRNLVAACFKCNCRKRDALPEAFSAKVRCPG